MERQIKGVGPLEQSLLGMQQNFIVIRIHQIGLFDMNMMMMMIHNDWSMKWPGSIGLNYLRLLLSYLGCLGGGEHGAAVRWRRRRD